MRAPARVSSARYRSRTPPNVRCAPRREQTPRSKEMTQPAHIVRKFTNSSHSSELHGGLAGRTHATSNESHCVFFLTRPACRRADRPIWPIRSKRVHLTRVAKPPKLDDFLNGNIPPGQARIDDFRQNAPSDGAKATRETVAYLSYDDEHLYVFSSARRRKRSSARAWPIATISQSDDEVARLSRYLSRPAARARFLREPSRHPGRRHQHRRPERRLQLGHALEKRRPHHRRWLRGLDRDPFPQPPFSERRCADLGHRSRALHSRHQRIFLLAVLHLAHQRIRAAARQHRRSGTRLGRPQSDGHSLCFRRTRAISEHAQLHRARLQIANRAARRRRYEGHHSRFLHARRHRESRFQPGGIGGPADHHQPAIRGFLSGAAPVLSRKRRVLFRRPTICSSAARIQDPEIGARLTGRAGPWQVGFLAMDDRYPGNTLPSSSIPTTAITPPIGVLRVQRDIGEESYCRRSWAPPTISARITNISARPTRASASPIIWCSPAKPCTATPAFPVCRTFPGTDYLADLEYSEPAF